MKMAKLPIKRIGVYLALGFAINWIVVWGLGEVPRRLAMGTFRYAQILETPPADGSPRRKTNMYEYKWFGVHEIQYGTHRRTLFNTRIKDTGFWWSWAVIPVPERQPSVWFDGLHDEFDSPEKLFDPDNAVYARIRYGWPAQSVQVHGAYDDSNKLPNGAFAQTIHGAISLPTQLRPVSNFKVSIPIAKSVLLPYHPIWAGLVFNTIFYGCVVWILLSIKRAYRHARRMRKGNCPMCSYNLEFVFVDGCPECGWRKD